MRSTELDLKLTNTLIALLSRNDIDKKHNKNPELAWKRLCVLSQALSSFRSNMLLATKELRVAVIPTCSCPITVGCESCALQENRCRLIAAKPSIGLVEVCAWKDRVDYAIGKLEKQLLDPPPVRKSARGSWFGQSSTAFYDSWTTNNTNGGW